MRLMQVHKSSSGDKPILPQPFDFSRYAGRQSKLLMRTDVKRREIWEWRDHTPSKQLQRKEGGCHASATGATGPGDPGDK